MTSAMQERMLLLAAARLCSGAGLLGIAGIVLALLALGALGLVEQPAQAAWAWWLAALPAPAVAWLAFRLRVDARVFADLAGSPTDDAAAIEGRAAALDAALATLLGRDAAPVRTLADRARGARRLVVRLFAVTAFQFAAALFAALPV